MPQEEIETLLVTAGFTMTSVLPGPPNDFKMIVAGRRDDQL
jgi:hypothetical protein